MESLSEILNNISMTEPVSADEWELKQIEWENSRHGSLDGYDCTECLNRGYIAVLKDIGKVASVCKCMEVRKSLRNIEKSGLKLLMDKYTLDTFTTNEPWQKSLKDKAVEYIEYPDEKWFAIFGQTGCGKTHICTAIAGEFLRKSIPVYYMLWNTKIKSLRATVNDGEEHENEVRRLQTIEVLYIDDMFKCKQGAEPSDSDVRLAFEILNARYNARLKTLISSEYTIERLVEIDSAIAGRINEMGGRFIRNIEPDESRNYRWKNES
jgi:DNA replication protein DnaC